MSQAICLASISLESLKTKLGLVNQQIPAREKLGVIKYPHYLALLFIFNQLISILIQSNNKHRTKIDKWRKSSTIQVFTILLKKFSWIWMLKICGQIDQSMQCSGWGNLYAFQKQAKKNGLNLFNQWRVLTMKMLLFLICNGNWREKLWRQISHAAGSRNSDVFQWRTKKTGSM